ncbi:MAG: class I tRNA ligase family protein, partial [Planctomycetota bacterium]
MQDAVAKVWDEERCFHAEPDDPGEPFSVLIPPPNVTAALHLGHAFNNTLQDILVRRARMQGKNAVWLPGTDHAGIATQTVVEKRVLKEEGKRRIDFERDEFVAKIQSWKDEYEARITEQLKLMGCSCDFERQAFTMDEPRAAAVREAFFRLFKDGLIYRGKRLVNWDPATQTALADDEVENEDIDGHFYYLKYPVTQSRDREGAPGDSANQGSLSSTGTLVDATASLDADAGRTLPDSRGSVSYVTVATTRPETMLGDTAVAINPKDPRAASLRGKKVLLPIADREIPIVEDDYVVMPGADDAKAAFATGFLKVTPAHDQNDWDIGQRHDLPVINIMAPDASISADHGWTPETDAAKAFVGLSREEARKQIVAWFKENNLLEEIKPYRHSVGHSYRSH